MSKQIALAWQPIEPEFRKVLQLFAEQASELYLVGGAVRDLLLAQDAKGDSKTTYKVPDLDLLVPKDACRIARNVANAAGWAYYPLDPERDIARIVYAQGGEPLVCDVARYQGESLAEDLAGRDFTVNAMALRLHADILTFAESESHINVVSSVQIADLVDNHGGLIDLRERRLRCITAQSFVQDPARLLRAIRLSAQLSFQIEIETEAQIAALAPTLHQISQERIRDEIWKALATLDPAGVLMRLNKLGLLNVILPEVIGLQGVPQSEPHVSDVYHHTLSAVRYAGFLRDWLLQDNIQVSVGLGNARYHSTVEACLAMLVERLGPWRSMLVAHFGASLAAGHSRADWLVWFALFHDIGKPLTRTEEATPTGKLQQRFFDHERIGAELAEPRLKMLHFSRDELKVVDKVLLGHMRPHHLHVSFAHKEISHRACFRFFRDVGKAQGDSLVGIDVILLALADYLAIYAPVDATRSTTLTLNEWAGYLDHAEELLRYGLANPVLPGITAPALVNGHMIMQQLSMKPGPLLGKLLAEVAEAQAAGEVQTVADAIKWSKARLTGLTQALENEQ